MSDVMIEARDLTKQYGPVTALKNASFELRKGEVLGFLGPNGAGKTTTMKILTCFIAPTEGTATVNGYDVFEDPIGVRRAIGYLPENTPLYTEMLVLEYLQWVARMRGLERDESRRRIKTVVEETGLSDVISKEIRTLSKGYRQRVGLAQALIHQPPILILDEPLSGLDPNQAVEIRDLIKEIGKKRTVILSTHNLAEVQVTCNRVLIVAKGKIVADDTPDGLQERAGKATYRVGVLPGEGDYRNKDDAPRIREAFGRVKGVDRVRQLSGDNGELRFEILPSGDEDLRPKIFAAAVDGGFVLVELRTLAQNLERVFRDLTTGEPGDGKKRKKRRKATARRRDEEDEEAEGAAGDEEDADDEGASAEEDEELEARSGADDDEGDDDEDETGDDEEDEASEDEDETGDDDEDEEAGDDDEDGTGDDEEDEDETSAGDEDDEKKKGGG